LSVISIGLASFVYFKKPRAPKERPLTIAFDSKIISTDPRMVGFDPGSQYSAELRSLPSISFDQSGKARNILAQTIENQTSKVIVEIKKGVHFANGNEIKAQDIKDTYEAILNPQEGFPTSPRKGAFINVNKISVIDD